MVKITQHPKRRYLREVRWRTVVAAFLVFLFGYALDMGSTVIIATFWNSYFLKNELNCNALEAYKNGGIWEMIIPPGFGIAYIVWFFGFYLAFRFLKEKRTWKTIIAISFLAFGFTHTVASINNFVVIIRLILAGV